MEDWSVDYINSCCNELFQGKVTCELSPSKGRILRACRAFKQGELVFEESPLHIVEADKCNEAFLAVQRVCETHQDAYQPLWYWAALCSLTPEELPPLSALRSVRPEQQRRLLCLYHEPISEASAPVMALAVQLQLKPSVALKVEELLRCWILNCFEHSDDPEGYSAYFVSSFMSHSCKPNAIWHEGPDAMHVVRARLDIHEGDEICISYLAEDMLMQSAPQRRRALKKTKLFTCTCERCRGDGGLDPCRGFRCPHCGACGIFPPPSAVCAEDLARLICRGCGRACGGYAVGLLETERQLRLRMEKLDEDNSMDLLEDDVRQLQDMLGDRASGAVGPQHWLCERLWTLLVPWLDARGRTTEAFQLLEGRVGCQRKMFPWPNATRAWTMQKYCRLLLRHYKATSQEKGRVKKSPSPLKRLLARALTLQEEALQLLELLFGEEHRYAKKARRKLRRLRLEERP